MEIVRTEQVSKRIGRTFLLGPLDLRVGPGQILAVVGPDGSGKTTLLRLLWGFIRPDQGCISIFGMQPHLSQPKLRRSVGYLAQNPRFHSDWTVKQSLQFTGGFYGGWNESYGSRLLGCVDIDPYSKIHELSNGDQVKVAIVAACSHKPALLLLDEPTSAVDHMSRREILRFLRILVVEERVSMLLSCRLSDDLDYIADSVLMLRDGQAVGAAVPINSPEENR
jgi:ABC-2 type transport system ATP-binding protein